MIILDLKQGSNEWKVWRELGLGASDAPVIMGVSPWTSPFQLWLEKTGLGKRPKANQWQQEAMDRGNKLEPEVRRRFEVMMGLEFPPLVGYLEGHPEIRASFDGYNKDLKCLIEIKCPGKIDHSKAVKGKVPDKYYPQLQHQFLVSGATHGYYISFDGVDSLVVVNVFPDLYYMTNLKSQLVNFWKGVQSKTMPAAAHKDLQNLMKNGLDSLENIKNVFSMLGALLGVKVSEESANAVSADEEGLIKV